MAKKPKGSQSTDDLTLALSGSVASNLYLIRASSMQLVTTFATQKGGAEHLLPLADWQMLGSNVESSEDSTSTFQSLLPLENMAFLIADLSKEFSELLAKLERFSESSCMDVQSVVRWMEEASSSAKDAAETATRLVNSTK